MAIRSTDPPDSTSAQPLRLPSYHLVHYYAAHLHSSSNSTFLLAGIFPSLLGSDSEVTVSIHVVRTLRIYLYWILDLDGTEIVTTSERG
jgi:hypothetical protein